MAYKFKKLVQQFHFLSAKAFLVGFPFFLIGPLTPDILAQKLFLLFHFLDPCFSLDGFVVTAIDNLDPGFSLL